jgi:hypothetical protein
MKKRCKRKVWSTAIDPVAHAIAGAAITDRASLNKLRAKEYAALDEIVHGRGTLDHWKTLTDLLNLSEMMAKLGIGVEVLEVCEKAQDALVKAGNRFEKTGKFGFDGPGIQAMRDLIEYADLQQSSISRAEFERIIEKTRNYMASNMDKIHVMT